MTLPRQITRCHERAQELPLSVEFLKRHAQQHREAGDRASLLALTDLCRAILNLNEFAYID